MIDKEIAQFMATNFVATICCTDATGAWCFNCFYSFLEEEGILAFKSSPGSKHQDMMAPGSKIAGSVLPANINFAGLQGIQLQGVVLDAGAEFGERIARLYHEQFPMGKDMPGKFWAIRLTTLKLTDNTRGFGFKQTWQDA